MKNERRTGLADRRTGNERRIYHNHFGFPFVDSHGLLVTEDRRMKKDRRVAPRAVLETDAEAPDTPQKLSQQTA
ncbi:MAG: hypothetical protein PVF34_12045 [Gammaproteobacteria bacterium]|jgi:hypothetical protein